MNVTTPLGSQQLLALARCLPGRPKVILLDEPSEGIQPSIVAEIGEHLERLATTEKLAILLVEQDLGPVARLARRAIVMRKGQLVREVAAQDLANSAIVRNLLVSCLRRSLPPAANERGSAGH